MDVFEIRIQIIIDYSQENYSIDPGIFSYDRFSLNFVSNGGEASISEEPERFIVFFRVDFYLWICSGRVEIEIAYFNFF